MSLAPVHTARTNGKEDIQKKIRINNSEKILNKLQIVSTDMCHKCAVCEDNRHVIL